MTELMTEWYSYALGAAYVVLGVVLVVVAKLIKNLLTPYKVDEELTTRDNPALGVVLAGYFAGVLIVFLGASLGGEPDGPLPLVDYAWMMGIDAAYALVGILVLNLARLFVDKLVLYKFSTVKEIIEDKNVGTAAIEAGNFIATALIIAGAIHGEGSPLSAVVFFALGQVALIAFAWFHQLTTRYDVHEQIEKDNVAAGALMGLGMVALGVILLKATAGDLESWPYNLTLFAVYAVGGMLLLFVLGRVVDFAIFPGTTRRKEIAEDRNMNVAWVEGVMSVGIATLIFFML